MKPFCPVPPGRRPALRATAATLTTIAGATLIAAGGLALSSAAQASSHREAPFITTQPKVDGTDFYLFRSYEPGRDGYVTLVANYLPLQDAYGGPNYFPLDDEALYEIHIDNNGDGVEDITFQFRFKNTLKDIQLPVGGKNVSIPLALVGGLSGVNPPNGNLRETYTVDIVRGSRRGPTSARLTNAATGASEFDKPTDNIGDKSFGSSTAYAAYAAQHVYEVKIPGCGNGRMFVGQRKDPFAIDLGRFFDLINLNPLGARDGGTNIINDKNITALELEVPIACVATTADPVIGGWTTASMRQARLLSGAPKSGYATTALQGGPWVQVSRLGNPLVNEVVIGLKDKDKFNGSKPKDDAQFADYVTNPTAPAIIQALFPSAQAPTNFPRTDLVSIFLTGISGVNQPKNVKASEVLRLNTSLPVTPKNAQNSLGVLGGDVAGFPNGRRPGDDVVDITLRAAMGAVCVATGASDALKVGCKPTDAPAGALPFTDGALQDASQFDGTFPYLTTPVSGAVSK
jgi:hypothetical protein